MAKELQPERHMERKMTNLKIDPSSKGFSGGVAVSKVVNCPTGATSDSTGCAKQSDVDHEYQMPLQGMYYPADGYYGYYYPGFDGSYGEWDDQGYFLGSEGFELQYPLIQADNGSVLYYTPDPSLGYSPYHPYWPGAMVGMDGQYMAQQPSSVFSQPLASQGYCPYPIPFGSEVFPTYPVEATAVYGDGVHGNGLVVGTTAPSSKPNYTSMRTFAPTKSTSPSKSSIPQERDTSPALELPPNNPPARAQNKVLHNGSGFPATTVLAKDYFPISKLQGKGGVLLYPDTPLNIKTDGRGWVGPEKLKAGGKANNVRDVYREQKPDSQTNGAKSTLLSGVIPVAPEGNANSNNLTTLIHRDQNNLAEFSTKYDHALFYVIKSYSEDDIHKSIKYGVWASTPNGNRRLDGAFQNAQQKMEEEGFKCPIFLFFSVNASCQFCGVAEMIGRVDFNKKMDFWQQDKWTGSFPVKWHIIKDVPNAQFRHILLENNDNKPVTNSRDTQEVKFTQGIEMLNIVKNYSSKTSILDDFGFYESREKAMQERKIRLFTPHLEHLQKRPDGVVVAKAAGDLKPAGAIHQSIDFASGKKNE